MPPLFSARTKHGRASGCLISSQLLRLLCPDSIGLVVRYQVARQFYAISRLICADRLKERALILMFPSHRPSSSTSSLLLSLMRLCLPSLSQCPGPKWSFQPTLNISFDSTSMTTLTLPLSSILTAPTTASIFRLQSSVFHNQESPFITAHSRLTFRMTNSLAACFTTLLSAPIVHPVASSSSPLFIPALPFGQVRLSGASHLAPGSPQCPP